MSYLLNRLLDIEAGLRRCEAALAAGFRHVNCAKDEGFFSAMEDVGFLVDGRFISVIDMLDRAEFMAPTKRIMTLEAVGCSLSRIYTEYMEDNNA